MSRRGSTRSSPPARRTAVRENALSRQQRRRPRVPRLHPPSQRGDARRPRPRVRGPPAGPRRRGAPAPHGGGRRQPPRERSRPGAVLPRPPLPQPADRHRSVSRPRRVVPVGPRPRGRARQPPQPSRAPGWRGRRTPPSEDTSAQGRFVRRRGDTWKFRSRRRSGEWFSEDLPWRPESHALGDVGRCFRFTDVGGPPPRHGHEAPAGVEEGSR